MLLMDYVPLQLEAHAAYKARRARWAFADPPPKALAPPIIEPPKPTELPRVRTKATCFGGRLSVPAVQAIVAEAFDVSPDDIRGDSHLSKFVVPRQTACYLCADLTPLSLPRIARLTGGRDHTTILHAIRRTKERLARDPVLTAKVSALRAEMES